jgi:hypothetical protein
MRFASLQKSKRDKPVPVSKLGQTPRSARPPARSHPIVQARLRIGAPNDRFEQEADRLADAVMRMPEPTSETTRTLEATSSRGAIQRTCAACSSGGGLCPECAEEDKLRRQPIEEGGALRPNGACSPVSATAGACCQRKTDPSREEETFSLNDLLSMKEKPGLAHAATPAAATALRPIERGGQPIDHATRTSMEGRFGQDFGRVRIHRDTRAAEAAEAIGARAFTFGDHIAFGAGEFQPATLRGQRLLAHELTHVLQQTGTPGLVQRTCACTTGRRATGSEHTGLAAAFPHLAADDYCIIAPPDSSYNCIAWSVSNTNQWIWDQVDSVYGDGDGTASIADFDAFYQATQSLTPTDQPNSNTLVALFAKGTNPTHAALTSSFPPSCGQIPFTSKLGKQWAISHDLNQLEGGSVYGNIVRYYE